MTDGNSAGYCGGVRKRFKPSVWAISACFVMRNCLFDLFQEVTKESMAVVTIVMGSKSDYETVLPAYEILRKLGVDAEMKVMSAHRTPDKVAEFAKNAAESGVKVIVAAAGKAAHLAGFIAAHTVLPVIGLPVKSSTLDGLDSLLSVVQMPNGVPVATVAINGAQNAGILAAQMLALSDAALAKRLVAHRERMRLDVLETVLPQGKD